MVIETTIYRRTEEDRQQGGLLFRKLPGFGKTRWKGGKRNKKAGVRLIPDRVDIAKAAKVVEDRDLNPATTTTKHHGDAFFSGWIKTK